MEALIIILWVAGIILGIGLCLVLITAIFCALSQLWEWLKEEGMAFIERTGEWVAEYLLLVLKSPFLITGWVLSSIWLSLSKICLTAHAWGKGVKIRKERKRDLRRFYLKHRGQFKNWRSFKRWAADEGKTAPQETQDRYKEALEMLGLNSGFSKAEFKTAYRRLSGYVHPDKGCPTDYFVKKLNEAVSLIKRRRQWK